MSAGVSPLTMCGTTSRKRWQTPGAGESAIAGMLAIPVAERAAQYEALGMAPGIAEAVAAAADEAMDRCILALYRSAAQPAMARLSEQLGNAAARPGLVITHRGRLHRGRTQGTLGGREGRNQSGRSAGAGTLVDALGSQGRRQRPTRVLVDSEGVSLGRFRVLC
jgi:hypothetical protein